MTNTTLSQALAVALALTDEDKFTLTQTLIAMSGRATVSAPTALAQETVSQSAPTQTRTADAAQDVTVPVTVVKRDKDADVYALALGYPQVCSRNGHDAAKAIVRDAGFKWDESYAEGKRKGAYVGTLAQAKALGLTAKGGVISVTAEQVQAVMNRKQAKADKKAGKKA